MLVAKFTCPSCRAALKPANPIAAGKTVKCPKCATPFEVKEEEPAEPKPALDKTRPMPRPAIFRKDSNQGIAQAPKLASDEAPVLVAKFSCPSCQAQLKPANPIAAGKTVKCPKCTTSFQVKPEAEAPAEKKEAEPRLVERFKCPHCQAVLKPATPLPAGKNIKCPKCTRPFAVQEEEAKPPEPKPEPAETNGSADYEVVDDEPVEVSQTTCPGCQATLKPAKPVAVGKKMKCPKCQLLFAVAAPPKDDEPVVADVDEAETPAEEAAPANAFAFSFDDPPAKPAKAEAKKEAKKTASMAKVPADEEEGSPRPAKAHRHEDDEPAPASRIWMRVAMTVGISIVGIGGLAGAAWLVMQLLPGLLRASAEWKEFAPPNGRCSAMMPGTPEEKPIDLDGLPTIQGRRWVAEIPKVGSFALSFIDLAPKAHDMVFDELYNNEKRKFMNSPGSKLGEEATVLASGVEGKECQIELGQGGGQRIARAYLVKSQPYPRLYILVAEGPAITDKDEYSGKFFNSLQITSKDGGPSTKPPDKLPGPGSWVANPGIAQGLDNEIAIDKYLLRPPKFYQVMEEKGQAARLWKFQGTEKEYQQTPAMILSLEDAQSPYAAGTPHEALDLFFKNSDRYLGLFLPKQLGTEEGAISGIPFLRRRFQTAGMDRKGNGIVYLGRDGAQTIIAFAYDTGANQEAIVNLMETSVQTLRRKEAPPDVAVKPPDKPIKQPPPPQDRGVFKLAAPVKAIALSADGVLLAAAQEKDPNIQVFEVPTGKERIVLKGHTGPVLSLAFHGATLASGSEDKSVKVWDLAGGKELRTLAGHEQPVTQVAFSLDGKLLASSDASSLRVWDLSTGIELITLKQAGQGLQFTSNNQGLFWLGGGAVQVLDLGSRESRPLIVDPAIQFLAATPDGQVLATADPVKELRIWGQAAPKEARLGIVHPPVAGLAVTPDGRWLASIVRGEADARLFNPADGKLVRRIAANQGPLTHAAFSADGKQIATGGGRSVKVWDVGQQ